MSERAVIPIREDAPSALTVAQAEQLLLAFGRLEARLSAMEQDLTGVTILHRDALALAREIRARAGQVAEKYDLNAAGERKIRAAIKRDVLRQYGIADLHDLPARRIQACRALIGGWSSWSAIREASTCG